MDKHNNKLKQHNWQNYQIVTFEVEFQSNFLLHNQAYSDLKSPKIALVPMLFSANLRMQLHSFFWITFAQKCITDLHVASMHVHELVINKYIHQVTFNLIKL